MSDILATQDPFSPAEIARVSRRVTLPDGRGLGYAEYGPAEGPPVLYFHGWPSSRLEPAILGTSGIRIISVDRPGYGLSDAVSGRRNRKLADWPRDIRILLKALSISRFALFGMSGGAPYAAMVAAAMPDQVAALALVSGLGPPDMQRHARRPRRASARLRPLAHPAPHRVQRGAAHFARSAE
jgi:pimeloyl-ACP methyl ester carboxylesterase